MLRSASVSRALAKKKTQSADPASRLGSLGCRLAGDWVLAVVGFVPVAFTASRRRASPRGDCDGGEGQAMRALPLFPTKTNINNA